MAKGMHQIDVHESRANVWEFIRDMNAWAPLVPGYKGHTILSDVHSTWTFTIHYGVMRKKLHVKVLITEWKEPTKVKFTLNGINQHFNGEGFFHSQEINACTTRITGSLEIEATSSIGKLLQSTFDRMVIELTKELTEAVGRAIEKKKS